MANKFYEEESIRNIAEAIREKNGTNNTYTVAQMADAILDLSIGSSDGGIVPSGEITIKENGRYDVTNYASAFVSIASGGNSSSDLPSNVKSGVLKLEETSTTSVTITHGCGAIPKAITCLPLDFISQKATVGGLFVEGVVMGVSSSDDVGTKAFSTAAKSIANVTENTFDFVPRSASYPLVGGHDYLWITIS